MGGSFKRKLLQKCIKMHFKKIFNIHISLSLRCLKCLVFYTVEDKLYKTTGTLPDHFGVCNPRGSLNITACYLQLSRFHHYHALCSVANCLSVIKKT